MSNLADGYDNTAQDLHQDQYIVEKIIKDKYIKKGKKKMYFIKWAGYTR